MFLENILKYSQKSSLVNTFSIIYTPRYAQGALDMELIHAA
jgi:hypothetical protein